MRCAEADYRRRPVIVTRSGYTGEVGFELFTYQDIAVELWRDLVDAMAPFDGAVRSGGPRRPPPRDGLPALRPGPVRDLDRVRGGAVVGGRDGQGRVPRDGGAGPPARGRPAQPAAGAADGGAPAHPSRALPGVRGDPRSARSRAGRSRRCSRPGSGSPTCGRPTWPRSVDVVEVDIRGRRGTATVVGTPFVDRSPR